MVMVMYARWFNFLLLTVCLITATASLSIDHGHVDFLKKFQKKIIRFNNKIFFIGFELKVPFLVLKGGRLAICTKPEWRGEEPIEPFEGLFLILPSNKLIEIDNLNKLRGWIKINNIKQALSFVRLKTSPRTFHTFRKSGYYELEIVTRDQIDVDFCYGDKALARALSNEGSGGWGIVGSKSKLRELGLEPTKVQKSDQGYIIERTLLVADLKLADGYYLMMGHPKGAVRVVRVVEFVTQDGRYIRKKSYPLDSQKIRTYPWSFPHFE